MKGIERRLRALEAAAETAEPDPLITYPPRVGEPEASISEFYAKNPSYSGAIFVLPDDGRGLTYDRN